MLRLTVCRSETASLAEDCLDFSSCVWNSGVESSFNISERIARISFIERFISTEVSRYLSVL